MDEHLPDRLRLATAADEPALEALIRASVLGLLSEYHPASVLTAALGHSFGVDRQLIADGTYFVVEDEGGAIVGCGGWSKRRSRHGASAARAAERDELLDPQVDAARIRAFFVHPSHARRGIGSELMRACEQAIAASPFSRIEIAATPAGEQLYRRFGYVTISRGEDALPNGEVLPIVYMTKPTPGRPGPRTPAR